VDFALTIIIFNDDFPPLLLTIIYLFATTW